MPSFVEHALSISRKHAGETLKNLGDPKCLLRLAAHCYAIACLIPVKIGAGSLAIDFSQVPKFQHLREAIQNLADLPSETTAGRLYVLLVDALKLIERELARKPAQWDDLPQSTPLNESGPCSLTKEVVHCFVGHNALKTLREKRLNLNPPPEGGARGRSKEIPPPILQAAPHPSRQLDSLRMHWNSDPMMLECVLTGSKGEKPPLISIAGIDLGKGDFRLLLCPLAGPSNPQFHVVGDGRQFLAQHADSISSYDDLQNRLKRIVATAREQDLHLIIFPELMIGKAARRHLVDLLNDDEFEPCPYGVMAGSFHVRREASNGRSAYMANESLLYDHLGRVLLRHDKSGKFGVTPKVAAGPNKFFPKPVSIPTDVTEVVEAIEHEDKIELLETSLGRIAVAICADCIVQNDTSLRVTLERARPDLVLIAAMTPETERFETVMTQLAEAGIASVFVNAHCICLPAEPVSPTSDAKPNVLKSGKPSEPPLLAAVYLALFEPTGAPPTRIRWRLGATGPEVRYFKPKDFNKEWRPAQPGCGVTLLDIDGEAAGLVVELGGHATWRPPCPEF